MRGATTTTKQRFGSAVAGLVAGALVVGVVLPVIVDEDGVTVTGAGDVTMGGLSADEQLYSDGTTPVASGARAPEPASAGSSGATSNTGGTSTDAGGTAGISGRSETGVTDSTVKVGVILVDLGGAGEIGFAIDTGDQESQFRAFIAEANQRGVHGRRIEPEFATYDPLNPDTMQAACLSLAVDRKVFAVVAQAFYGPPVLCLTRDHGVPFLDGLDGFSDDFYAESRGLLLSHAGATRRVLMNLAAELHRLGALGDRKLGIVGHAEDRASVGAAVTQLRADGHAVVHESILPSDPSAAASAIPVEVQQMRTKGVTGVVLAVNLAYATMWVQQADGQQFRPRYFTSDYASGATDVGAGQMPPSYDGAIALTSYRTGEHRVGLPEPAFDAECAAVFHRRTGTRVVRGETAYSSTMHSCGLVSSAVTGLERAGPSLSRHAFVAGLRSRPPFTIPFVGGGASFGTAKHDAVDEVRPLTWSADCRCWLPSGEFRRTRF